MPGTRTWLERTVRTYSTAAWAGLLRRRSSAGVLLVAESAKHFARVPGPWPGTNFLQARGVSRFAWVTLSATALALGAVVAVAALLTGRGTGSTTSGSVSTPSSPTQYFSLPLTEGSSALAVAKHAGNLLVGLAARRGGPVEVAALRAETPVATDALEIQIDGRRVEARPCGRGCSRVQGDVLDGSPKRLTVRTGSAALSFDLPARLPPAATGLFVRAQKAMDSLRSFRFTERLSSGRGGLVTDVDVQAPNRVRLRAANGYRSVIIGRTRWDWSGGRWERGPFPGLTVAQMLMWYRAKHPRVVGRRSNGVTELAAFGLEPVPAWFRLAVAPTGRVVEAEMIAPSHFMLHRYSDFNGRFAIKAPK